ncbi:hypothetical protein [Kineococcus sp. SYSU DK006]|uniref:hypothetical protein n=1 Tax=Kineococcus sp. SYSU DK006 TaxID=3383127 RepID=UPI003D7E4B1D
MSTFDEAPADPPRGAQTVAPVQASALQFAASILGEGGYTPEAELKGTLSAPARVQEPVAAPAAEPVAQPAPVPAPAPAPAAESVAAPAPRPEPVAQRVEDPVAAPVAEGPRKGFWARLVAKLTGRG